MAFLLWATTISKVDFVFVSHLSMYVCYWRQIEERRRLEEKHELEIERYLSAKKAIQRYSEQCPACAAIQSQSKGVAKLCQTHTAAHALRYPDNRSDFSASARGNDSPDLEQLTNFSFHDVASVSKYLRTGKHYNRYEVGKVRRIRHNSVEQLMHRMISSEEETSVVSTDTESTTSTIREESTIGDDTDYTEEPAFCYPTLSSCKSLNANRSSDVKTKQVITSEVSQSHNSVLKKLQSLKTTESSAKSSDPRHISEQKEHVKQALNDSRAGVVRSIDSFELPAGR